VVAEPALPVAGRWCIAAAPKGHPVTPTRAVRCMRRLLAALRIEESGFGSNPVAGHRGRRLLTDWIGANPFPTCHGCATPSTGRSGPAALLTQAEACAGAGETGATRSNQVTVPCMARRMTAVLGAVWTLADREASTALWWPRCWPAGRCVPVRPGRTFDVWFGHAGDYDRLDSSRGSALVVVGHPVATVGFGATVLGGSQLIRAWPSKQG